MRLELKTLRCSTALGLQSSLKRGMNVTVAVGNQLYTLIKKIALHRLMQMMILKQCKGTKSLRMLNARD